MKIKKITIFIFLAALGLSSLSVERLSQNPLTFFVLKNELTGIKVYQIEAYFGFQSTNFEVIDLSPRQKLEAEKIADDKNLTELSQWSKSFGQFDFVVGLYDEDGDLISGWNHFLSSPVDKAVSDLDRWDKIYLSLMTGNRLANFNLNNETIQSRPLKPISSVMSIPVESVKTAVSGSIVRVEILNGCGIKGAAEWIAKRLKSANIIVKNGGNADKFTYTSSVVQSGVDLPLSVDQALKRLGFSNLAVSKSVVIPPGYDVVLIVGKDFQKLKGK